MNNRLEGFVRDGFVFKKSSFSPDGRFCVAVSIQDDCVLITDTKRSAAPVLRFSLEEWDAFLAGVKYGEFDRRRGCS